MAAKCRRRPYDRRQCPANYVSRRTGIPPNWHRSARPSPAKSRMSRASPIARSSVRCHAPGARCRAPAACEAPRRTTAGTGQRRESANSSVAPRRKHEPGDEGRSADQHRKGVVVEIARFQPHDVAGDVKNARRYAVRPKTIDQPAVAALPQQPPKPFGRANENDLIELVEIPLVEQEAVQYVVLACEFNRKIRTTDIELPGDHKADHHHHGWEDADLERHVMHLFQHM